MGLRWVSTGFVLLIAGVVGAQVNGHPVVSPAGASSTSVAAAVRNSPFSAEVITQYDRALDNGGHIHRETRGRIYRDSQGRMRTENEVPPQSGTEKLERVNINDPVQKIIVNLNPKAKTATIFHFGQGVGPSALGIATVAGAPVNVAPSVQPALRSPERNTTSATNGSSKPVGKISTTPVETRTEALGSRNIEGVIATGTRTTRTIDAGSMGNDKPIISVTETWFSPELKMTVLTETDDGQSGHSIMKLVNITRTEPIAQLFQVPSDYTVKDTEPATASVKH
jgi:hypothetical protein